MQNVIYCRWAKSLGALEGTAEEVWGTPPYKFYRDWKEPCVFFGLYDLRDYIALWLHVGKKWVLWAGSDIRNLRQNFIFNDGKLLWLSQLFVLLGIDFKNWLVKYVLADAEHWVENEAEAWQIKALGLKCSGICPSFLGDVKKYKTTFKPGNKVWASANYKREDEYGWGLVLSIAWALPQIEFHLYGSDWNWVDLKKEKTTIGYVLEAQGVGWKDYCPNVFVHSRVPKEQMNREIKKMQCGLRLNKHDGFSEVTAKSVLWGQYPITYLYNDEIDQFAADNIGIPGSAANLKKLVRLLKAIPKKKKPNTKGRNYYRFALNKYPWNLNKKNAISKRK